MTEHVAQFKAASAMDLGHRASPLPMTAVTDTAPGNTRRGMHNFIIAGGARDEGGPFGFGRQGLISSYRKLLWSKAMVVIMKLI